MSIPTGPKPELIETTEVSLSLLNPWEIQNFWSQYHLLRECGDNTLSRTKKQITSTLICFIEQVKTPFCC